MNIREKTQEELQKEIDLHRGYKDYGFKPCKYSVLIDGLIKDVHDLSEQEVYRLCGDVVRSFGESDANMFKENARRLSVLINCWKEKHSASDVFVQHILKATYDIKDPAKREVARDLTAGLVNTRVEEIRNAYNMINGTWPNGQQMIEFLTNSIESRKQKDNEYREM